MFLSNLHPEVYSTYIGVSFHPSLVSLKKMHNTSYITVCNGCSLLINKRINYARLPWDNQIV